MSFYVLVTSTIIFLCEELPNTKVKKSKIHSTAESTENEERKIAWMKL